VLRLLLQPRWLRAAALTAVVSVVCCLLGVWQWHRREGKLERIALITANYDRDPVPLADLLPDAGASLPAGREWTPVSARGTYAADETVLVRNRPRNGSYGYLVLVPLRLEGGGTVLVDRGWIPNGATGEAPGAVPVPPAGPVAVRGRLRPGEPADERGAPAGQVQTIDLDGAVGEALRASGPAGAADAEALRTGAYVSAVAEDPAPAQQLVEAPKPDLDEGPHLGYTLQWFVFAAGAWVFFGVQLRRTAREEAEDAVLAAGGLVPEPGAPAPPTSAVAGPRRRRAPSDEETEDALLDARDGSRP